jgi:hypothetical protein
MNDAKNDLLVNYIAQVNGASAAHVNGVVYLDKQGY